MVECPVLGISGLLGLTAKKTRPSGSWSYMGLKVTLPDKLVLARFSEVMIPFVVIFLRLIDNYLLFCINLFLKESKFVFVCQY